MKRSKQPSPSTEAIHFCVPQHIVRPPIWRRVLLAITSGGLIFTIVDLWNVYNDVGGSDGLSLWFFIVPSAMFVFIAIFYGPNNHSTDYPTGFAIDGSYLFITYKRRPFDARSTCVALADVRRLCVVTEAMPDKASNRERTWFKKRNRAFEVATQGSVMPVFSLEYQDRARKILYEPVLLSSTLTDHATFMDELLERCQVQLRINGSTVDRETWVAFMDAYRAHDGNDHGPSLLQRKASFASS